MQGPQVDDYPRPPPPPPPLPSFPLQATAPPVPANSIELPSTSQFYFPAGPSTVQVMPQLPAPWSSGLFDCSDDVGNCCVTCLCPCITFGQIAEIVDRGSISCGVSGALYAMIFCVTGCVCLYSCFYRSKMRGQYFLEESPCVDCIVHCCCESCALCQEYRELKARGFEPRSGWRGNLQMHSIGVVPPTVEGRMKR